MPQSIVSRAAKKLWDRNSSALIISLLGTPVSCEPFTEEESIVACFLHLAFGPYEILQGLSMVVAGLILAPIPCLVGVVATSENISPHYMTASIRDIGLTSRSPHHPCHYNSTTYINDINGMNIPTNEYGTRVRCAIGCTRIPEIPNEYANEPQIPRLHTQTVTGYNLITAGLARSVDGVWSTATALPLGVLSSLFYFAKKAINARSSSQLIPAENIPIAYRLLD